MNEPSETERDYKIEVCRICREQLGRTVNGRCRVRAHWSAGGEVVEVVPASALEGAEARAYAEGFEKGRADGFAEGRAQGYQDGVQTALERLGGR